MSSTHFIVIPLLILFQYGACQMMPMPFPGPMPGYMPPAMPPGMPPLPMPMPMPMSMPMPMPMPQPKLPVVVMPFYSKQKNAAPPRRRRRHKKKKRILKKYYSDSSSSSDSDTDVSLSTDINFRTINRREEGRGNKRQQILTPVVSYVTKDGYVIYQKEVKKSRAKDWLQMENGNPKKSKRKGISLKDLKRKIEKQFSRQNNH